MFEPIMSILIGTDVFDSVQMETVIYDSWEDVMNEHHKQSTYTNNVGKTADDYIARMHIAFNSEKYDFTLNKVISKNGRIVFLGTSQEK
jgi:hypothetical protein